MIRLGFLWVALIAAIALVGAAVFKLREDQASTERAFAPQATPVATIDVAPVEFADTVEALGNARANESVTITSKVTEVISRIAFDSGDEVHAGDVLAELADAEESANLTEARSTLDEAVRERGRYTELENRGVASTQAVDELDSNVDRARARVRTIEARLADRIVRAPFDGVVGLRDASPGMLVRPGDVIATLDDVSVIKVDFTVPERFLSAMAAGAPIKASVAAYPGETFVGEVSQVDSRVDPVTRSAIVRAVIDNSDSKLLPGMLMVVEVVRNEHDSLAVPELALVREAEAAFVYVVEQGPRGMIAKRRNVTTGARSNGRVEITAGLEAGEQVVSEGVHRLRDGAPVTVTDDGSAAPQVAAAGQGA